MAETAGHNSELTPAELREFFDYDREAGVLRWRTRPRSAFKSDHACNVWNARFSGKIAGTTMSNGYRSVSIHKHLYLVHRVIWAIETGEWPSGTIDHEHGRRSDNRFVHLRDIPKADNSLNSARRNDNTSGVTGVSWDRKSSKWHAYISVDGRRCSLGLFHDLSAAAAARKAAEVAAGYHPNHGRIAA